MPARSLANAGAVLIAAFSGRSLAAAARRAGFIPYVVDAFGDDDTRESADAVVTLPAALRGGFRAKPLLSALSHLATRCTTPPLGLVLGVGFEDRPQLIATLGRHYKLSGCSANTVRCTKDLAALSQIAGEASVTMPETQRHRPAQPDGWLVKRIGGSGGAHVHNAATVRPGTNARRHVFQRRCQTQSPDVISLLGVGNDDDLRIIGYSRQWCTPTAASPFRFGGVTGPVDPTGLPLAQMTSAARAMSSALVLVGLVSFDFLLTDTGPVLIEINPRPGITLDIFDDANGGLFANHIAASKSDPSAQYQPPIHARAAAYLYADRGRVTVPTLVWPTWTADRPAAGTRIPEHAPLATVFADAETANAAEQICRQRLGQLADMIYAGGQQEHQPS